LNDIHGICWEEIRTGLKSGRRVDGPNVLEREEKWIFYFGKRIYF
jgi:hypothetical protein